jgi:hypothetical protein
MSSTLDCAQTLVTDTCCMCGVLFAWPAGLRQKAIDDHSREFFCPNGHPQHFLGVTPADRERARAERAERRAASREEDLRVEKLSHRATRGQLTKTRNRIARGVCPHCHRTFPNIAGHMSSKHPDKVAEASQSAT